MSFYTFYNRPPSPKTVLDYETKFVSQAEADLVGLQYQLQRYGMDGLQARFEQMKDKFGYADTRLIPSFAELQNRIVEGTKYFEALPSEIRAKFGHKPANYFEFLEKQPEEALKKGYISAEQKEYFVNKYKLDKSVELPNQVTPDITSDITPDTKTVEISEKGEKVSAD